MTPLTNVQQLPFKGQMAQQGHPIPPTKPPVQRLSQGPLPQKMGPEVLSCRAGSRVLPSPAELTNTALGPGRPGLQPPPGLTSTLQILE